MRGPRAGGPTVPLDARRVVDKVVPVDASARAAVTAVPVDAAVRAAVTAVPVDASARAAAVVTAAVDAAPREAVPAPAAAFEALHEQAKEAGYAGNFEQALALCQRALKLRPDEPRAQFNCAVFAYQLGNCTLAERYLANLHHDKADKLREKCKFERAKD